MAQQYTRTTRIGWGQRLMQSFKGILTGVILIGVAVVLLWWNEGRAVNTAKGLAEGSAAVVAITPESIDPANEGRLVHVSGQASSGETLSDSVLGVQQRAIALIREVEMFQWREDSSTETRTRAGGAEERVTTYRYRTEWSSRHIDSSRFDQPAQHRNPAAFPINAETRRSSDVSVGALGLSPRLIAQISQGDYLRLDESHAAALPSALQARANTEHADWLHIGNPMAPEVGDLRIRLQVIEDQPVSILARQTGNGLATHTTSRGTTIERLRAGHHSAEAMFEQMVRENTIMTWGLRVLGIVLAITGFGMILKPVQVVADVLPILGSIAAAGVGLVSAILGTVLSLLTIALAWLFYRPLLSIVLLAICGGLIYLVRQRGKAQPGPDNAPAEPGG
ncbi:MAG: hypothetical protein EA370_14965 [Wenzhouxiangella sp.]|nr:MAG: hypothetical protein EA370_14965 [Wenzhouxiangella sp.]